MNKLIINILFSINILIGAYSIFQSNIMIGFVYTLLFVSGSFLMVYSYCAKCISCAKKCAHPQFGYLRKFLPKRKIEPYKAYDYLGVVLFILISVAFPQSWLWGNKLLFVLYWIISILMAVGIGTQLCSKCENKLCKMNKNISLQCN